MRGLAVFSAILLQACLFYEPSASAGVGAFAYQDSIGNRYGGTYGLKDGEIVDVKGDYPPPDFIAHSFQDLDDFFPEYFRNLEHLLGEAFGQSSRQRDLAFNAAHKAFNLASNRVGYMPNPNLNFRFPPFGGNPDYQQAMPFGMSRNSAFAGAAAGPGFSHHIDAISPENRESPNVNVKLTHAPPNDQGFYSVSSSSYSSSSNVDGQTKDIRGSETLVNNNGVVTHYKVTN